MEPKDIESEGKFSEKYLLAPSQNLYFEGLKVKAWGGYLAVHLSKNLDLQWSRVHNRWKIICRGGWKKPERSLIE